MIPKNINNILILKWGALGDLIMATSTIKAIRDNFPNAKITMFTNNLMNEILPQGIIVDEYVYLKKSGRYVEESFFKQLIKIWKLRKRKFDLAVDLKWKSERASVLTYLSGAKIRVGYWERIYNKCYTHSIKHPVGGYHEVHRNLDVIKQIGLEVKEENPLVYISEADKKFACDFFASNSLHKNNTICIHPGASKSNRAWQPERFSQLAKLLIEKYNVTILLTWGKNEFELVNKISNSAGKNTILSPATNSISRLAAIIQNCSLFISVCTGPMNVANAVKTPIVALLGSTDPADWSPYGEIHRTIKSPLVLEAYTDEDERKALDAIKVKNVWDIVDQRWNELKQL
ncbi:MAG: glycosyltransferase family 9 protein [Melioribacter sp.]|nr:glycosyltransferase family 9 protein [Melioribacter sp.]